MISKFAGIMLLLGVAGSAAAGQVYQCKDDAGVTSFQSTPCQDASVEAQEMPTIPKATKTQKELFTEDCKVRLQEKIKAAEEMVEEARQSLYEICFKNHKSESAAERKCLREQNAEFEKDLEFGLWPELENLRDELKACNQ